MARGRSKSKLGIEEREKRTLQKILLTCFNNFSGTCLYEKFKQQIGLVVGFYKMH